MPSGTGLVGRSQGYVQDQTELLQIVVDGLGVYNQTVDPIVAALCEEVVREVMRVPQAPISFQRHGDGGRPEASRQTYRLLQTPLQDFEAGAPFTVLGLQDALPSDIEATLTGVMAGDAERQEMEFFRAIFTPQTAGSVGTAYRAGFWNGETDVPDYKNTTFFGTAHNHYKGINTATLALSHIQDAIQDVREHGYGLQPGSLVSFWNTAQTKTLENLLNITVASSLNTPSRTRAQDMGALSGVEYAGCLFAFNDNVPSGYFTVIDTMVKPLAKRVHLNPAYRGLQIYAESMNQNYPLAGQNFLNRYGFAVRHLGAGTCRQIVASTSFTAPTFRLAN